MPTTQFAMESVAGHRPDQDGPPRSGQPDDPRARRRADPAAPRRRRRPRSAGRTATRRPSRCSRRGETFGVFQLESAGMRRAVLELKPTRVDDLAALVALYRPGPMQHIGTFCRAKHGLEQVSTRTPTWPTSWTRPTASSSSRTRCCKIAQKFAGYSLGAADIMRKAMGKKIAAVMQAEHERFIGGAMAKGYSQEDAAEGLRPDRAVRGLRLQQGALLRLRHHRLPDGLAQGELPEEYLTRRAHAGRQPPRRRPGAHRPGLQRVRAPRHPGAAARRQQERRQLPAGGRRRTARPASASAWR